MTQTTTPRFVQIHFLTNYPAALLNRDDSGLSKRLPYGGTVRQRTSSQCLKRHWRTTSDARSLHAMAKEAGIEAYRSKEVVERLVVKPMRDTGMASGEILDAAETALLKAVYGPKAEDKRARQALLIGRPEVEYLRGLVEPVVREAEDAEGVAAALAQTFKDGKANLTALRDANAAAAGLESALFGRMVTSDTRANVDAAIHVAHAFTVHDGEFETDYFTAVDDLTGRSEENDEGDTGAAGVFDTEIASGLFYGYVVVDVPLLVSNLEGVPRSQWDAVGTDRTLAARVVENLVHLIATVSPGAKKGSTAPYAYASMVLVETGERQPRTLARAFQDAVPLTGRGTIAARTSGALKGEIESIDAMYGPHEKRRLAGVDDFEIPGIDRMTLPELATSVADAVRAATA